MSRKRRREPKRNRLHKDVVERLHMGGGPHGSKKGGRGYDRQRDKKQQEKKKR